MSTNLFETYIQDSNKHIIEEFARQVGHLPELYEDARSEKYKKKLTYTVYTQLDFRIYSACVCKYKKIGQVINEQNEIRYNGPFWVLIDQPNKRNR